MDLVCLNKRANDIGVKSGVDGEETEDLIKIQYVHEWIWNQIGFRKEAIVCCLCPPLVREEAKLESWECCGGSAPSEMRHMVTPEATQCSQAKGAGEPAGGD